MNLSRSALISSLEAQGAQYGAQAAALPPDYDPLAVIAAMLPAQADRDAVLSRNARTLYEFD